MREYRIQCEDDPWPAGQRPIGSAHPPAPVTFTRRDLQRACPLTCNGTAIDVQSSTVARSHPTELATEDWSVQEVCRSCAGSLGVVGRCELSSAGSWPGLAALGRGFRGTARAC